jgi:hypothetical protein
LKDNAKVMYCEFYLIAIAINVTMILIISHRITMQAQLGRKKNFAVVKKALSHYLFLNRDINVPYRFCVPNEETLGYPSETHGMRLGAIVSRIRNRGDFCNNEDNRKSLISLGVLSLSHSQSTSPDNLTNKYIHLKRNREEDDGKDQRFEEIFIALTEYKKIYGHLNVPVKFVVPTQNLNDTNYTEKWPKCVCGLRLGQCVDGVRNKANFIKKDNEQCESRRRRLMELGFKFKKLRSKFTCDQFLAALTVYKDLYDDLLVPHAFVVPSQLPWSPDLYGMRLGHRVSHVRCRGSYPAIHDTLTTMGFCWDYRGGNDFNELLGALALYELTGEVYDW